MKLPKLFEDRMRNLLGDEYEEYLKCYDKPHFGGIRVNTLKISPEEFENLCPFSIKKIPWVSNGYYYDINDQPARHPYYYAGLYYIQEPSAMTPASLLPVKPGEKVLDLCAAPGGKSTELGAKLKGKGLLVSNDISSSRAKALLKNIELFGISNAFVISESPNKLAEYFPEFFDKILVDAPCSGEGMFRKSPSIMQNWEQYGVDYYNKLQKEIIIHAARMLKPGGMMLYSTCTFSPEENEGTIAFLLKECPEFHVVEALPDAEERQRLGVSYDGFDFGKPEWVNGPEELKHCLRLWPHKINGEGHFIALLKKDDKTNDLNFDDTSKEDRKIPPKSKISLSDETVEFLKRIKPLSDVDILLKQNRFYIQQDRVYLIPEGFEEKKGLRTLRQGLFLGEMKKNRFEPSQALAMALKSSDYDQIIDLKSDNQDVIKYLKCETLTTEGRDGLNLVCVDGYPLGWGKLNKNVLKNMYLPGWRWM
ncbi:RsmF rRNA methyltransferase first C-terminal domain-containing protein [Herbinix hemicellulosilytica]|nr:RsmB/NOP family class I SAM-dependent RNA methyltransferase [Herbinix hemicellulosilytica]